VEGRRKKGRKEIRKSIEGVNMIKVPVIHACNLVTWRVEIRRLMGMGSR
jgi:hypothetical protein